MSDVLILIGLTLVSSLVCGGLAYGFASLLDQRVNNPHQKVFMWRLARLCIALPGLVLILSVAFADHLPRLSQTASQTVANSVFSDAPFTRSTPRGEDGSNAQAATSSSAQNDAVIRSRSDGSDGDQIRWIDAFFGLYALGLMVFAGRFVLRRLALYGLTSNSLPATDKLDTLFRQWLGRLDIKAGSVRLRLMRAPLSPFVIGLRPTVFLPRDLAAASSETTAEIALVHELIHVRRRDEWDRLIGEAFSIVFWFNPMLGWIEHRLALVREMACDAETLDVLGKERRRAYACALVDAARVGPLSTSKVMAFGSHHKRSKFMRVKAILSPHADNRSNGHLRTFIVAGFAAVLAPAFAAQAITTATLSSPAVMVAGTTLIADSQLQSLVDSSPILALEQLESLQSLESLGDVAGENMMSNPANWAAIGAYATGASDSLRLRTEDEEGNPVVINISGRDGEEAVYIEFTDEEGRANILDVSSEGNEEMVSLRYDGQEPHFSVTSNEDDQALINFIDNDGAPIRMEVAEEDDDTARISISDESTGEASDFRFTDRDDDLVRAPADGRISHVGVDEGDEGLGQYVVIDHGTGWSTIFYHLVDTSVAAGDRVSFDQVIGQSTGDDHRGQHSHMNINDTTNMSIVRTRNVNL